MYLKYEAQLQQYHVSTFINWILVFNWNQLYKIKSNIHTSYDEWLSVECFNLNSYDYIILITFANTLLS